MTSTRKTRTRRQGIEEIAVNPRGNDQNGRALGGAATIEWPHATLTALSHHGGGMLAAIGFKSSWVALGAMRNLGLDRPFDWFSFERVDLGSEVVQLPARDVRGQRDGLQHGQRDSRDQPEHRRAREVRR